MIWGLCCQIQTEPLAKGICTVHALNSYDIECGRVWQKTSVACQPNHPYTANAMLLFADLFFFKFNYHCLKLLTKRNIYLICLQQMKLAVLVHLIFKILWHCKTTLSIRSSSITKQSISNGWYTDLYKVIRPSQLNILAHISGSPSSVQKLQHI